jgi:hypothetical protein
MSPNILSDNRALSVLNLASNSLGEMVLPEGWTAQTKYDWGGEIVGYTHADGRKQNQHPGKPEGIIAIANAIPDMGALTKLDISRNDIGPSDIGPLLLLCAAGGIELAK